MTTIYILFGISIIINIILIVKIILTKKKSKKFDENALMHISKIEAEVKILKNSFDWR